MSESQPITVPNAKRKRTTMRLDPPSTASGATRSPRIWLEDGNVIIQAQTTQFRVHRGILSRHSRVFKDMFAIPQPELGEPVIEGCPIFRLFDAAQDWENLLTLLYDGSIKSSAWMNDISLGLTVSMLRLGKKYEFKHFRQIALQRLRVELPHTLEACDKKYLGKSPLSGEETEFDLLNIALEVGVQTVLPVAFYWCLQDRTMEEIIRGIPRKDGTVSQVTQETKNTLVLGKEMLSAGTVKHAVGWLKSDKCVPCPHCNSRDACKAARFRILEMFWPMLNVSIALDPVGLGLTMRKFCTPCATAAREVFQEGRKRIWEELPSYFGLPKWEDLRDFDRK